MEKIRLGIIGTGLAAKDLHWPAIRKMSDKFIITAVCNHTELKAKEYASLVGDVPYVLDYRELLSRPDMDAVILVLPVELNLAVTRDALQAGKHVMVEKPLAVNMEEADQMMTLDEEYPQVTMVAENFRYLLLREKLLYHLEKGTIGDPRIVTWDIHHHIDPETNRYAQTKWRINHKYAGGFVTDGGVHNMALLRDVFGEIVSSNAWTDSLDPSIGDVDSFSFQFRTEKGINGFFNLFLASHGISENRIIVLGTKGGLFVKESRIILYKNGTKNVLDEWTDDGGYVGEYNDFYEAIVHGKPVRASFAESYRDLEIILQAVSS